MTYEQILTETRDRVGVIRLNRPEKLNAWTGQMSSEIIDQMTAWNADPAIGAILLAAEGRAFCAGADLNHFAQRVETNSDGSGEQLSRGGYGITQFMRASKPTLAAVNGYAVGVGLTMILPCDVRIASTEALMSIRFIKMGLIPELGSTRILSEIRWPRPRDRHVPDRTHGAGRRGAAHGSRVGGDRARRSLRHSARACLGDR